MKLSFLLLGITMSATLTTTIALQQSSGQLLDIKPWHGDYPEMNGHYPLSFTAFKGWLFPAPHVFVRTFPTHYYVEVGALPVTDSGELAARTKTGLLRIAARLLERRQIKERQEETRQIRDQTELRKVISRKLFEARKDELPDIYELADQFLFFYEKIDHFDESETSSKVKRVLTDEADALLVRFLMAGLLEADHGDKLESLTKIRSDLEQLAGEADYTYRKLCYLNQLGNPATGSYAFLCR